MSAPVTHIVLADKILNSHLLNHDRKMFILGASFPDIRYISNYNRGHTHSNTYKIKDLFDVTPFMAGVRFHSIVDVARENYLISLGVNLRLNYSPDFLQNTKLIEDIVFYDFVDDWQNIVDYFSEPLEEETSMGFSKDLVNKWHDIIRRYIVNRPNNKSISELLTSLGFPNYIITSAIEQKNKMSKDEDLINNIKYLYNNIESLLI